MVSHAQVVQNLVPPRRHWGENPLGINEMEREFESRFPLQNSFPYKGLRGNAISVQGILREFSLTLPRGTRAIDGALLPDGIVGLRHAAGEHHLDTQHFRVWSLLRASGPNGRPASSTIAAIVAQRLRWHWSVRSSSAGGAREARGRRTNHRPKSMPPLALPANPQ